MGATVVSLINMKGVGKTTLAVGLAWELARSHKVLLVDVDPQFNATQWVVPAAEYLKWLKSKHTIFDVFSLREDLVFLRGSGEIAGQSTNSEVNDYLGEEWWFDA